MQKTQPLTRASIFAQAWPIMLGQASVPLVGIVDAAVVGRTGDAAALAGVALGATIISMVFWSFGFLRMGMTGLTAQAEGSGDEREVAALLLRSLAIGAAIGFVLVLLQWPIGELAFALLAGGEEVSREAGGYVGARFFGAPAALCVFAINGWLLGLGRTRAALLLQVVMNIANIALDIGFVWGLGMGARGVGLGTAGAEWIALATGLVVATQIAGRSPFAIFRDLGASMVFDRAALARLFAVNRDLMIRTIALLFLFAWFANAGARLGAVTLAANHVLLQFVSVAAFVLDAFAFTAESRIGKAIGANSPQQFRRAIRLAGEFSLLGGVLLSLVFWLGGSAAIHAITTDPETRAIARDFLFFAALIPVLGMPSWLLDGIFIGATAGRALRNAAVISTLSYLALDFALRPHGNWGVWIAFTASYILRAAALGAHLPSLMHRISKRAPLAEAKPAE
ncbi:MATE family multidrug resistance protein [Altererythrobacter atlanticus]|uniref:DNA-damage-inducible protein F n=1 Tax=Croceibacterium atlanticum TaxID=1267766 RepID=A0A0F7KKV2_9SPHN|nr:MATE family efflux transporter [Croceibacterium atlanticum]AKH41198.1 DNA-damage-inducible protein F [Croceibacterium atlanticum]MBB5732716.1 MATE family multidrug resistance protein [Croceibacterium atlanticum]